MIHNKLDIRVGLLCVLLLICSYGEKLLAQQPLTTVNGIVTDDYGKPLEGVTVAAENGSDPVITDLEGKFALAIAEENKYLVFSRIGYINQKAEIVDGTQVNVKLLPDFHKLNEVVQLGYTTQLRNEVSGAVSTISGEELEKSPVANLSQSFAGRFCGMFTNETYSELSRATTDLHVRGFSANRTSSPLVMIDGILCSYLTSQTLEYISANEIESVSVLKDASTQALYGIQGANGLIVIKTRRGDNHPLQINARFDQSLQQVTTIPTFISSAEYATLRNQAAYNDGDGEFDQYTADQIGYYSSGENRDLYPNNNWYDRYWNKFAAMQRFGINATGGNERLQFYSNVNVMHQGGQFNTDQTEYETNDNEIWANYRTNVDMKINRYLKTFVRLSGNIKRERTTGANVASIYSSMFSIPSNVYGPLTPTIIDENTGEVLDEGGEVITTENAFSSTYGMLNRTGYIRHTVTNITSQFGLDLDLGFLTKGLSLSGTMAYQTNSVGSLYTTQDYERWMRTDDLSVLEFVQKGSSINEPLGYSKGHSFYYHLTYNAAMNYRRSFGKHNVSGIAYMFYQNLTKADTDSPNCLPYNRLSSGAEIAYGYDNRYFVKFDAGYSGSEKYARNRRFIWTPAVSVGWLASDESFLNDVEWLNYLKFRVSYGVTGNDRDNQLRYSYTDNVSFSGGGEIEYLQYLITEGTVGNPNYEAEKVKKQDYGVDLILFNDFSVTFDYFKERTDNMIIKPSNYVPKYQGIPLDYYPLTNTGKFENKGYEISMDYRKKVTKDLTVNLGGYLAYTRNKEIYSAEAKKAEKYAYAKNSEGYSYGQAWGYLVDYSNGNGFFNSQSELENSNLTYEIGTPRVGDLIYKDLTNDNIINECDMAPIGKGYLPRYTYAVSGGINFGAFELSFLFQGVGDYSAIYDGTGVYETAYDGVYGAIHQHAWTQERYEKGEKIEYPALSLGTTSNHVPSDFFKYNRSYLRLKNIELSYTLPDALVRAVSLESARIILSGQNLLTWDHMKSDDFGPEGTYESIPVYRVYNIGVSVSF